MKKQFMSALFVCALLTGSTASAKDVFESLQVPPPSEEVAMEMRLVSGLLLTLGLHKVSSIMELKADTQAMLHASHAMVQLGGVFSRPAATRVGVNMGITAVAAGVASTEQAKGWIRMLPFVGANLELAGTKGVAVATGWLNDIFQYAYQASIGSTRVGRYLGLYEKPCESKN